MATDNMTPDLTGIDPVGSATSAASSSNAPDLSAVTPIGSVPSASAGAPDLNGVPVVGEGQVPPKDDEGMVSKAWNWATKGLIGRDKIVDLVGKTMDPFGFNHVDKYRKPGESASQYLERLRTAAVVNPLEEKFPWLAGIRVAAAGMTQDAVGQVSSFTSPVGLAMLATGPVSKAGGAVGTLAKVGTQLASAEFAREGLVSAAGGVSKLANAEYGGPSGWISESGAQGLSETLGGAGGAAFALHGSVDALSPTAKRYVNAVRESAANVTGGWEAKGRGMLSEKALEVADRQANKVNVDKALDTMSKHGIIDQATHDHIATLNANDPAKAARVIQDKVAGEALGNAVPKVDVANSATDDGHIVVTALASLPPELQKWPGVAEILKTARSADEVSEIVAKRLNGGTLEVLRNNGHEDVATALAKAAENHIHRVAQTALDPQGYLSKLKSGYDKLSPGVKDMDPDIQRNANTVDELMKLQKQVGDLQTKFPQTDVISHVIDMLKVKSYKAAGAVILGSILGHSTLGLGTGAMMGIRWAAGQEPVIRAITNGLGSLSESLRPKVDVKTTVGIENGTVEKPTAKEPPTVQPTIAQPGQGLETEGTPAGSTAGAAPVEDAGEPNSIRRAEWEKAHPGEVPPEPVKPTTLNGVPLTEQNMKPGATPTPEDRAAETSNTVKTLEPETAAKAAAADEALHGKGAASETAGAEPVNTAKAALAQPPAPDRIMQQVAANEAATGGRGEPATPQVPPEIAPAAEAMGKIGQATEGEKIPTEVQKTPRIVPEAPKPPKPEPIYEKFHGTFADRAKAEASMAKHPGSEVFQHTTGPNAGKWGVATRKAVAAPAPAAEVPSAPAAEETPTPKPAPAAEAKGTHISEDPLYDEAKQHLQDNPNDTPKNLQLTFRISEGRAAKLFHEIKSNDAYAPETMNYVDKENSGYSVRRGFIKSNGKEVSIAPDEEHESEAAQYNLGTDLTDAIDNGHIKVENNVELMKGFGIQDQRYESPFANNHVNETSYRALKQTPRNAGLIRDAIARSNPEVQRFTVEFENGETKTGLTRGEAVRWLDSLGGSDALDFRGVPKDSPEFKASEANPLPGTRAFQIRVGIHEAIHGMMAHLLGLRVESIGAGLTPGANASMMLDYDSIPRTPDGIADHLTTLATAQADPYMTTLAGGVAGELHAGYDTTLSRNANPTIVGTDAWKFYETAKTFGITDPAELKQLWNSHVQRAKGLLQQHASALPRIVDNLNARMDKIEGQGYTLEGNTYRKPMNGSKTVSQTQDPISWSGKEFHSLMKGITGQDVAAKPAGEQTAVHGIFTSTEPGAPNTWKEFKPGDTEPTEVQPSAQDALEARQKEGYVDKSGLVQIQPKAKAPVVEPGQTAARASGGPKSMPVFSTLGKWANTAMTWADANGIGREAVSKAIKDVNDLASVMAAKPETLEQGTPGNPIRSNADFGRTVDLNAICPNNDRFLPTVEALQKNLNRILTPAERVRVAQEMQRQGETAPCAYCYVEQGRWKQTNYQRTLLKEQGLEERLLVDPKYRAEQTKNNPELEAKLQAIEAPMPNINVPKKYSPYVDQIMHLKQDMIDAWNNRAGLRFFSATDFQPEHVLDLMQVITDASIRKLKGHCYTKRADTARIFGNTGLKINMSIAAEGGVNGEPIKETSRTGETLPWKDAFELRKTYPNAGTMMMVTNDAQMKWGMQNPDVDMMIPFHGGAPEQFKGQWNDYAAEQHENFIKGGMPSKRNIAPSITMAEHGSNLDTYLKLCQERGVTPKFARFIYTNLADVVNNGAEPIIDKENAPGYMKLVKDVARTDSPHTPLHPDWDMNEANRVIKQWQAAGGTDESPSTDVVKTMGKRLGKEISPIPERKADVVLKQQDRIAAIAAEKLGKEVPKDVAKRIAARKAEESAKKK